MKYLFFLLFLVGCKIKTYRMEELEREGFSHIYIGGPTPGEQQTYYVDWMEFSAVDMAGKPAHGSVGCRMSACTVVVNP